MNVNKKKFKIIAMIPARMGSKRVKKKNIRLIDGKPLIQYIIDQVKKCKIFDEIYINSENIIFKKIASNNKISFFHRDKKLASDKSTNDEFTLDFMKKIKGDILIQILPTSPLITSIEIKNFVKEIKDKKINTLISVEEKKISTIFKNKPINFNKIKEVPPSQMVEPVKSYATVLMGWKYKTFLLNIEKYKAAYHGGKGRTGYFTLSGLSTIDIDNEEDFDLVEKIIISKKIKSNKIKKYFKN